MMFSCADNCGANFDYIFTTFEGQPGYNPPSNSLFDLENMQTLVDLGFSTPNVLVNTTLVLGSDFNLSSW
jgi:hypothetical protein